ncbi:hypothetical protein FDG2_0733 [Candidatus Protofrankia californiensis]|uniref:Uncharacterized protein n=1 Tax=Candidatus Protofrankia californiensis TaxID=1839754 RepID=A0A1C3NU50_9ACTN|nr:hypothetical protein FDG2_0733 [Candidatus Protofrankia californiensis]
MDVGRRSRGRYLHRRTLVDMHGHIVEDYGLKGSSLSVGLLRAVGCPFLG